MDEAHVEVRCEGIPKCVPSAKPDAGAPMRAAPDAAASLDRRRLPPIELPIVLLALLLLVFLRPTGQLGTLSVVFVSIVLEALPFVLIGALLGGFIEVFVPREKLAAVLPARSTYSVLLAGLMGVIFPVCECAVVPVVRRLVRKGVPFSAAVTYLLAGPIVNPIVAASTVVAYGFDWQIATLRLLAGYAIAVAVGTLMGELFPAGTGLLPELQTETVAPRCGCADGPAPPHGRVGARTRGALQLAVTDFLDIGRFLVLGAFIAGLTQTYVDRQAIALLTNVPPLSVGAMMLLAVALNLCSEADAFVAVSYRGLVPLAAQMAFLVLGPMLDLKLLLMYLGLFRRRATVALAASTFVFVLVTMGALAWLTRSTP